MTERRELESIPDVVLRLARLQLAEEIAAPLEPFFEPAEGGDAARHDEAHRQTDAASPLENRKLQNDDSSNLQFGFFNSPFAIPTPPDPPLRRGGYDNSSGWGDTGRGVHTHGSNSPDGGADPIGAPFSNASRETSLEQAALPEQTFDRAPTDSTALLSAACGPAPPSLHQGGSRGIPPFPPLRQGGSGGVSSEAEDTANTPFDDTQPAGNQGSRGLVDAIDDHGRHFEQVLSDLEQSLSRLFMTQIEILNHLGDTARQHERRWQEQSTTRRATFSV